MEEHPSKCDLGCSNDSDDESYLAFAKVDLRGANFNEDQADHLDEQQPDAPIEGDEETSFIQRLEKGILFQNAHYSDTSWKEDIDKMLSSCGEDIVDEQRKRNLKVLCEQLCEGKYADILTGETTNEIVGSASDVAQASQNHLPLAQYLRERISSYCHDSLAACVEVEIIGVAAFNLFLQLNYTGPSIEMSKLQDVNPHQAFADYFKLGQEASDQNEDASHDHGEKKDDADDRARSTKEDNHFHNQILSDLAVDGEIPCQVCDGPYFLYFARVILLHLADPERLDWTHPFVTNPNETTSSYATTGTLTSANHLRDRHDRSADAYSLSFATNVKKLRLARLWSARAAVAHQRLLQAVEPSETLWNEVDAMFKELTSFFFSAANLDSNGENFDKGAAARVTLERGLAEHHFDRKGKGKDSFRRAKEYSGLSVEVTGAEGKRTKFQQNATAQLTVRAVSKQNGERQLTDGIVSSGESPEEPHVPKRLQHDEEEILLERVKFEDEKYNVHEQLSVLDQAILLSLCLDVKNDNPMDGLTAEQMGAYLERVLMSHDDWMIYSTALLERAWLECERSHARERAILQIQALVDQHTQRLSLTQSTFKSIEEEESFAPVQKRLTNLHSLVYPPRWEIKADLATRYSKMGILTTAAEMFESLEMFPEAVECYQRASKLSIAEQVVRERLKRAETPRMWAALGDITKDPSYYQRAIDLSNGKFSSAFVALGKHHFENGDLDSACDCIGKALMVKPLNPGIWFYFGTINMRLENWERALEAFSEVVQQEPEEGEAWANVAAIHMRNTQPAKAYPALVEALKQSRSNWRIWQSKLCVCLDLQKYDEAIQACTQLMDLRMTKNMASNVPPLEERCVKGIVGGALKVLEQAKASQDVAAVDSASRTIDRVSGLLDRLRSTTSDPWIWQVCAYFNDKLGNADLVLDDLLKEHRALQATEGWETNATQVKRVCEVALQICAVYQHGSKESHSKARFMVNRLIKKIRASYVNEVEMPAEVSLLEEKLQEIDRLFESSSLPIIVE